MTRTRRAAEVRDRNLLVVVFADLAAILLEPCLRIRCGRARWF